MKFEYCELEVSIGGPISGTTGTVFFFMPNGKHTKKNGNYGELLAELGSQGWEIVASSARIESGLGNKHKINYILKRTII